MRNAANTWKRYRLPAYTRRRGFRATLVMAVCLAVLWWAFGLWFGGFSGVPAWADQRNTFTQAIHHLADPYTALAWPYVPWAVIPLIPFGLPSAEWAVLAQMVLYFAILTAAIYKFGGGRGTVILVLTSALALDTALEINLEWLACLGLLVPRTWSGPFLLIKPQAVSGYWFGFRWREIVRGAVVVLVVAGLALLVWPGWPGSMVADIRENTLGDWGSRINIAPAHLLDGLLPHPYGLVLAYGLGALLALRAFRRHDVILGVVAWQLLVPYATFYGIMPVLALGAIRWPRIALAFSTTTWLLYASVLLPYVLGR